MNSDFAFSTTYWSNNTSLLSQTEGADRNESVYSNNTLLILLKEVKVSKYGQRLVFFQRKQACLLFLLMFPAYFIITAAYFPVV